MMLFSRESFVNPDAYHSVGNCFQAYVWCLHVLSVFGSLFLFVGFLVHTWHSYKQ